MEEHDDANLKDSWPRYPGWCSFCRKHHHEVGPLAEGPDQVYICYGCANQCADLIEVERQRVEQEENWGRRIGGNNMKVAGIPLLVVGGLMVLNTLALAFTRYDLNSSHDVSKFFGGLGMSSVILLWGAARAWKTKRKRGGKRKSLP